MKGLAISTVGALILAVLALVLLWLFVAGGINVITQGLPQAQKQITSAICSHQYGSLSFAFCK